MKDILITPNRYDPSSNPKISFVGASAGSINLEVLEDGTVSFLGNNGMLFSIVDDASGVLMSINNISGFPIFEVLSDGIVNIDDKLNVDGSITTHTVILASNPVNSSDAVNLGFLNSYIDSSLGNYVLKTGDTMSGDLTINSSLSVSGTINLLYLQNSSTNYILYYNPDTSTITYSTTPSGGTGDVTKSYVDGSLATLNASVGLALSLYIKSASIGSGFYWNSGSTQWDVSAIGSGGVSQSYVDGSLATLNSSVGLAFASNSSLGLINSLNSSIGLIDASVKRIYPLTFANNSSIGTLTTRHNTTEASLGLIDASLKAIYPLTLTNNASIGWLKTYIDGSLTTKVSKTYVDGSLALLNASIGLAFASNSSLGLVNSINASIGWLKTYADGSLGYYVKSSSIGYASQGLKWNNENIDVSISVNLKFINGTLDVSITSASFAELTDGSIVNATMNDTFKYDSSWGKWVNKPDLWELDIITNNVNLYDPNTNLELSSIELQENGGILVLTDMVCSSSFLGSEQSYSMDINGSTAFKVFGISASTALSETAVVVETTYLSLGDPQTDGSWRFMVDTSGNLSVQKRESGSWVEKGNFM